MNILYLTHHGFFKQRVINPKINISTPKAFLKYGWYVRYGTFVHICEVLRKRKRKH